MGHHVAVVRAAGEHARPIRPDELRQLSQGHADFVVESGVSRQGRPTQVLVHGRDSSAPCRLQFDEDSGELWMANPTRAELDIMLRVAHALGGRVRDDGFRTFRTATDTWIHPDDEVARSASIDLNRAHVQRKWRMDRVWWCVRGGALLLLVAGAASAWLADASGW